MPLDVLYQFYPGMLSAQLVGRLLPEIQHSGNIRCKNSNQWNSNFARNLLRQCDTEGIKQNALVIKTFCIFPFNV